MGKFLETTLLSLMFMLTGFLVAVLPGTATAHNIGSSHDHPGSCHSADVQLNFDGHMYLDGTHGCLIDNNACDHENHLSWKSGDKYGNNCCGAPAAKAPSLPPPANIGNSARTTAKSASTRPRSINSTK